MNTASSDAGGTLAAHQGPRVGAEVERVQRGKVGRVGPLPEAAVGGEGHDAIRRDCGVRHRVLLSSLVVGAAGLAAPAPAGKANYPGSHPGGASSKPANSNAGATVQPTSVNGPVDTADCQAPAGTVAWGRWPDARSGLRVAVSGRLTGHGDAELERRAGVVVPGLGRVDPVPVRALPGAEQEVDRGAGPPGRGPVPPRLGVPAALGMGLQPQRLDDLVGVHRTSVALARGSGPGGSTATRAGSRSRGRPRPGRAARAAATHPDRRAAREPGPPRAAR